jgi:hypothetical protein
MTVHHRRKGSDGTTRLDPSPAHAWAWHNLDRKKARWLAFKELRAYEDGRYYFSAYVGN